MNGAQPATSQAVRPITSFDLEKTLVAFITALFSATYRLDNPTLNLAQPDVVPFDYTEREQSLELKVAPKVYRGRVPRTVTGEINVDQLPDAPAIIVQAVEGKVGREETIATVRIMLSAYDENPKGHGYQDLLNMIEVMAPALTSYGQAGLDEAYVIVFPLEWKIIEADTFPHHVAQMTCMWELPSARPLPDQEKFGIIPGEHLELKISEDPQLYENI